MKECSEKLFTLIILLDLEIKSGKRYNHNLKRLLFKYDFIKNPLGVKCTEIIKTRLINVLFMTSIVLKNENNDNEEIKEFQFNIDSRIVDDVIDLYLYMQIISNYDTENQKYLDANEISQKSFIEQLLAVTIFFQGQIRNLNKSYSKYIDKKGVTGLELSISTDFNNDKEISGAPLDTIELLLESINQIIRYLFYKYKND
ncbi:MAG: hypothetical protein K6B68_04320, partial [Eubacterium sp.]|nr:hypothetical protein [Eubacterium sp.]